MLRPPLLIAFNLDTQDTVGSTRKQIKIVRRHHLILNTKLKQRQQLLLGITLIDKQVLHMELRVLAPPQSEAAP